MRSFFAQQHHMTIYKIYNGQLVFLTRILTPLVHPSALLNPETPTLCHVRAGQ